MKIHIKRALICLTLANGLLLADQALNIEKTHTFKGNFDAFKSAIELILVKGNKNGINQLVDLLNQLSTQTLAVASDEMSTALNKTYFKFNQVIIKICTLFKNTTSVNDLTLDLSNNFDINKLFQEALVDIKELHTLAVKNNHPDLAQLLQELTQQIQTEQKKWAKPNASFLTKLVQSVKAYLKK